MVNLLLALAVAGLLFLVWQLSKTRRLVRELKESVSGERRLLLGESSSFQRAVGLEELAQEVNTLVDKYQVFAAEKSGYSSQVEATLGSIYEAVIIFDESRVVVFANESARRLFQTNRSLRGSRLESTLRSASLLEFLDAFGADPDVANRQVTVEKGGETLWFEASCAPLEKSPTSQTPATLLVLHDITRLKSLEMIRRDFVANVSHELRTPLTIIKGFAETLVEDNEALSDESRLRFLEKILNNAERLHLLVEDLLTLSRLESKPEQVVPEIESLKKLLNDTMENYKGRLEEGQEIIVEFDERIGEFAFDRFRINQVLDNLVENAFRYAADFSELKLIARYNESTGMVDCAVSDNGPGIPAKDVPHLFERFYRVDKGRSRERGGTGLGLSITKHIVQLHGGKVSAQSEVGAGTSIIFALPYTKKTGPRVILGPVLAAS